MGSLKYPNKQEVRAHIRWMIRSDMPEVIATEDESFEFPWLEEDFIRCLRQRNCIGMVADHNDRIAGFMIYELHNTKIHVLNFAVASDYRRHSVGSQMVNKLKSKLSYGKRNRINLEIRESNLPAQLFFREQHFRAVSVLRSYYKDTPEDAYLMQYKHKQEENPFREIFHYQDSNKPNEQRPYIPFNRITKIAG